MLMAQVVAVSMLLVPKAERLLAVAGLQEVTIAAQAMGPPVMLMEEAC